MMRVAVNPDLLRWARERARLDPDVLMQRFPKLQEWEAAEVRPTLRQLESFARATHVPIGFFFLDEPPREVLPIPDFRTMGTREVTRPSPNLLDTIYLCQERQSWYRDFAAVGRHDHLAFVGSLTTAADPVEAAAAMRGALGFDLEARRACPTWIEALRQFVDQADRLGVLVMASGIVGSNTHRGLDPEEFRGFALSDPIAPLVFVNGADTKAAQMFTLAHELAHLWLGSSALSDATVGSEPTQEVERWCNVVAAELLVPLAALRGVLIRGESLDDALARLARHFKVSTLVILRRMKDCGWLDLDAFRRAYSAEVARLIGLTRGSGGDFYRTTVSRIGRRFCRALIESTLEGNTLYRDAFRMLGVTRSGTFDELSRNLGFAL